MFPSSFQDAASNLDAHSSSLVASGPRDDSASASEAVRAQDVPPSGDLVTEGLITLTEATRYCPRRRKGRKAHFTTVFRWATRGIRGECLEVIDTPSGLCTSRPALLRFFAKLTVARNLPRQRPQPPNSQEQQHEAVEAELKRRFRI
jgi:hypothetical protein